MKKLLRSVFVFVLAFSLVLGTGAFTNVGTINVNAATAQVKITPNSKTIYVGKTTKLKVKKKAKKAKLTWKSSNKRVATVYNGNIIKNLIMDCQSYTKYRPNETTGGIFVSWRRKEELPTGA